jgi:dTDP-glucose 4,6-dehydratase
MRSKLKTLLIIGGSGFFAKSIIDNIYYYSFFKKIKNIILLSRGINKIKIDGRVNNQIKIRTIRADIAKLEKIPFADYVIYCAINYNYDEDYKAVKNYLNLAKEYHLDSKILYISSGAVYGKQLQSNKGFKENYLQFNNKIFFKKSYKKEYSKIKLKNEKLFQQFGKTGAKVSIARCFSFVGRHLPQNSHYVVGNIINNVLRNKDINIKANYRIIRSYMYSDDLVRWLLKILENSNAECPIYNVGSDDAISIQKLASTLSKKYNLKLHLHKKILENIIDKYIPNIQKVKKELNLVNNYSSINAIVKTINLLKKNEKTN